VSGKKFKIFHSFILLYSLLFKDYADHPDGHPLSEIAERGNTNVKVLSDEEIEGLKVSCKVCLFFFNNIFCYK
jgi:hypothetical protein